MDEWDLNRSFGELPYLRSHFWGILFRNYHIWKPVFCFFCQICTISETLVNFLACWGKICGWMRRVLGWIYHGSIGGGFPLTHLLSETFVVFWACGEKSMDGWRGHLGWILHRYNWMDENHPSVDRRGGYLDEYYTIHKWMDENHP